MKRPDKVKFAISKPPDGVTFSDTLSSTRSIYIYKIQEALRLDSCISISASYSGKVIMRLLAHREGLTPEQEAARSKELQMRIRGMLS